jgi:hypothetical protein
MLLSADNADIRTSKSASKGGAKTGGNVTYDDMNSMLDPVMLRRIPDQIHTGFYPYDTDV